MNRTCWAVLLPIAMVACDREENMEREIALPYSDSDSTVANNQDMVRRQRALANAFAKSDTTALSDLLAPTFMFLDESERTSSASAEARSAYFEALTGNLSIGSRLASDSFYVQRLSPGRVLVSSGGALDPERTYTMWQSSGERWRVVDLRFNTRRR